MEPLFAGKTTYDETLFYHQVLASKPKAAPEKKKWNIGIANFGIKEAAVALVVFMAVYMASGEMEMSTKILQSAMCGMVTAVVLRRLNERKNGVSSSASNSASMDKKKAAELFQSSDLDGEQLNFRFSEDSFTVEGPGITTEYRYEGIAWIKETKEYFLIFWNSSTVIPVAKAGFTTGKREQFGSFLEKRCNKTIEKVRTEE